MVGVDGSKEDILNAITCQKESMAKCIMDKCQIYVEKVDAKYEVL